MGLLDQAEALLAAEEKLAKVEARNAQLVQQIKIQKAAMDHWVPCSDHRDNRAYDGCPVCRDETRSRRNAQLVAALEFYADPMHWSVDGTFTPASPDSDRRPDCGDTARKALAANTTEGE